MIKLTLRFFLSIKYFFWYLACMILLYMAFSFLDIKNMVIPEHATNVLNYINGLPILPIAFLESHHVIHGVLIEIVYACMVFFPVSQLLFFCLNSSSSILFRIQRISFLNKFTFLILIYSVISLFLYVISFSIFYNDILSVFSAVHMVVPMLLKLIIITDALLLFIYLYIKYEDGFLSTIVSIFYYIGIQVVLQYQLYQNNYLFESSMIFYLLILCVIPLLYMMIRFMILKKDLN